MANIQVSNLHPVKVGASNESPKIIKNETAATIYYRASPYVSEATNDGSLAEGESVRVTTTTWIVTNATAAQLARRETITGEVKVFAGGLSPGRRQIYQNNSVLKEKAATAKVFYANETTGIWTVETAALTSTSGENALANFYYDPALYEVGGVSLLTLEVVMAIADTAPTSKFDFQLYKVETSTGLEKKSVLKYEAALENPKLTINAPAAKSLTHSEVTAAVTTAGIYTVGLLVTTESVAKSFPYTVTSVYV